MKKFLIKIMIFFALAAIIDVCSGCVFDLLRSKARGGQTYKNEYLFTQCKDDILILGSSKADHHYVPSILTDSLGVSCYNAGEMGCGIIPAYFRYNQVKQRKKPLLVIYEVTPRFDYLDDHGYSSYLGTIRQYTHLRDVRDVYLNFSDELERFRLLSNMYRNNSKLVTNLKDIMKPTKNRYGYDPLYGKINPTPSRVSQEETTLPVIDSLKLFYFETLIKETIEDKVPLVFIVSPSYQVGELSINYNTAIELSKKYNVPFINNKQMSGIAGVIDYFQDGTHLNHTGAMAYTKAIVPQIKAIMTNR